jgi:hypothetical protein
MEEYLPYLGVIFAFIFGGVLFRKGFAKMHQYRIIKDIPQSKVRSVAAGICEIQGTVKADQLLKTPFSQIDCVFFRYKIEEYRIHVSRSSKGGVRTSKKWVTIASGDRRIPFYGHDDTGKILIIPDDAEFSIDNKRAFYQRVGVFDAISNMVDSLRSIIDGQSDELLNVGELNLEPIDPDKKWFSFGGTVGDRRYYEAFLTPEEAIYVIGTAAIDPELPDEMIIKKGEAQPTFIISNKSEKKLLKKLMWSTVSFFLFSGLAFSIGIYVLLSPIILK